jgi:hypothetical protein
VAEFVAVFRQDREEMLLQAPGLLFSALDLTPDRVCFSLSPGSSSVGGALERGEGWALVAPAVVFFAASGFILVNIGDKTAMREQTMAQTPAVEAAQRALDDAKGARDRECAKVGPSSASVRTWSRRARPS